MNDKKLKKLDYWDCDNDHAWLSYPGPHKDTWHLEQLHPAETGTFMKRDPKSAWLVAGVDPSICPLCAMRMRMKERQLKARPSRRTANLGTHNRKISA